LQGRRDDLEYPARVSNHVVIPEPKDTIIVFVEPSIAHTIPFVVRVLPAIDFNDQSALAANKIDHVWTDRFLAHELVAINRT
jgi:hypothetical protein